ncbi:ceramide kinase-like [Physella acuta]|uniref:ceramide kinase-like n=1 Tax=Physella acuta TaxID=109671 RepID=UPI0027DE8692|nr:ceramide kinase-like [Physella acuta]
MEGSFMKRGRQCDVSVTKTHLKCTLKNNLGPNVQLEISLSDVLAVQTQSRDNTNVSSVVVHYAGKKKDKVLTWEKLVLAGQPELCKELNNIFSYAFSERQRPKHYLVLINPRSGSKTANRLFHKKVAPLFRACGITFKVYVTTGPNDARNAFQDVDFSTLDGVISVGGDGFYSEVVTALVLRQQQITGVNPDDPDATLSPLSIPVGVIPGGSGNYVVNYLHGTTDPVTSAIKIVLGKTCPTNIVGIHQGKKLEGYAGLIAGFGLFGDMMYTCEKYRWMGNVRYKVLPVKCILSRRLIEAEVEYQTTAGDWRSSRGSFYSIETGIVDLADSSAKLVPVFGDSALTLHLVRECPLGDHIKQLSKVAEWASGAYDYNFVQSERVLRYKVSLSSHPTVQPEGGDEQLVENMYMNCDGEALKIHRANFQVRLHTGIVQLFGTTHTGELGDVSSTV